MKIESLIRRAKGTVVEFDDRTYHFKPTDTDPRHQAEVDVEAHAKRLLAITEGYAPLDGGESPFPVPKQEGKIAGSLVHSAQYTLQDGSTISLDELTSRAFRESGLSIGEWNELSDEDRYEHIDTTLGEIQEESKPREQHYDAPEPTIEQEAKVIDVKENDHKEDEPKEGPVKEEVVKEDGAKEDEPKDAPVKEDTKQPEPAELDRDELAKQFEAKFGRKPNGKLSARSIQKALEED